MTFRRPATTLAGSICASVLIFVSCIIMSSFLMMSSALAATEQALIVHFDHVGGDWSDFFAWQSEIAKAIDDGGGDFDGNELAVDGSDGTIYMYGPDADKLLSIAKPILLSAGFLHNIEATLRYGSVDDKNAREMKIRIKP